MLPIVSGCIMNEIFAAIEEVGTKWICAQGTKNGEVLEEISIPTQSPEETLFNFILVLRQLSSKHGNFKSIGIGTFGPIVLNQAAENYGSYLETPKKGWSRSNTTKPLSGYRCKYCCLRRSENRSRSRSEKLLLHYNGYRYWWRWLYGWSIIQG